VAAGSVRRDPAEPVPIQLSKERLAVVDDLSAILDELAGWLADERSYGRDSRRREWASLIEDAQAAFDLFGDNLRCCRRSRPC
jgi:hypothetical protein